MGKHQAFAGEPLTICDERAVADEDVVAAPFCGLDCFHMHWRWSLLSDTVANINIRAPQNYLNAWNTAPSYRGWDTERSHSRIGSVLIPPNQHLDMHIAALDPVNSQLDKILDYHVTVTAPAPGENQVILEQGMGWAMIESDLLAARLAVASVLVAPPIPLALSPNPVDIYKQKDPEAYFYKVYDFIRFHHECTRDDGTGGTTLYDLAKQLAYDVNLLADKMTIFNHAQVPTGSSRPTLTWPSAWSNPTDPDVLLALYRQFGDAMNPSLYWHQPSVLVEGNAFDDPDLTIEHL